VALLAAAVRIAITGEVYSGPTTTPAPTTSVSALNVGFIGEGYVSEEGITETYDDTIEDIIAWQNATIVRAVTTASKATLSFRLIEFKGETAKLYHKGSTVAVVSAGQWKMDVVAPTADPRSFVFDIIDGVKHLRIYVANGEVTERGEIVYANGEPIGFEVTVTCYPSATNVILTKFSDDTNFGYS
jgi:hypothetical protein